MATCRDIITQALYRTSILALGRTPKAKETENGMFLLQGLYDGLVASGALGELTDVYKTEDYEAQEFERVFASGATITLPTTITDDGPDRQPKDLAVISIHDGTSRTNYVWEDEWVSLTGLALADPAPFASRGQDGFACYLAMQWVDTFGGQVGLPVIKRGRDFHAILMGRNATKQDAVEFY